MTQSASAQIMARNYPLETRKQNPRQEEEEVLDPVLKKEEVLRMRDWNSKSPQQKC